MAHKIKQNHLVLSYTIIAGLCKGQAYVYVYTIHTYIVISVYIADTVEYTQWKPHDVAASRYRMSFPLSSR